MKRILKLFPPMAAIMCIMVLLTGCKQKPFDAEALGNSIADAIAKAMPSSVVVRSGETTYKTVYDPLQRTIAKIPEHHPGQGSGVIVDPLGYVLTSHHVVYRATQIQVELGDGRLFEAKVVGKDPFTDLAVLKIICDESDRFRAIKPGDSDSIRVGEFVIALGSPLSLDQSTLENTATFGIVSQKGRVVGMLPYEDFIQTDAIFNPGNSGGALIDVNGRLVGINTLIYQDENNINKEAATDQFIGYGFSVPGNLAMRVARTLISEGRINHPWIGIKMQPSNVGAFVTKVLKGAPGSRAGIQAGDFITHVNGQRMIDLRAVKRAIFNNRVGDMVSLTLYRNGESLTVKAQLDPIPPYLFQYQ